MLDILGNEILKLLLPKDGFVTIDYPIHVYLMVFEGNCTTRAKNVIDEYFEDKQFDYDYLSAVKRIIPSRASCLMITKRITKRKRNASESYLARHRFPLR